MIFMSKKAKTKGGSVAASRARPGLQRRGGGVWSRLFRGGVRVLVWVLLVVFLGLSAWGLGKGFHNLFFLHNGHFTLETLVIDVYGDVREGQVRHRLNKLGVELGQSNLFELDLGELRRGFQEWDVPVKQVRFSRRLPSTLIVRVFEHEPVAQLRSRGHLLIDKQGIVLPVPEGESVRYLPLITPVKGGELRTGLKLEDDLVHAALHYIEQVGREREYSELFDVRLILLDYESGDRLTVKLGARGPFCEGALVVLPVERRKMDQALRRVERIARERLEARQITGFIDATYEVNIPVRKKCP